ncbi:hypothetical protein GCM10017744_026520 [Streptomyces antimycoticus]
MTASESAGPQPKPKPEGSHDDDSLAELGYRPELKRTLGDFINQPQIFSVVTSIAIIMIYFAYLMVTLPMLVRRLRGQWRPAEGRFTLGRLGLPVNVLAVLWGTAMTVNLAWPGRRSTTPPDRSTGICAGGRSCSSAWSHWAASPTTGSSSGPVRVCSPSTRPPPREERPVDQFDYVVVGGGTAGSVVASRLSEDPSVSVCLLEAGPSDLGDDNILRLNRWMWLLESGYDWDYPVERQEKGNSFLRHARAKVLGGCSSHNSCIAFWAPAEDLDEWAAMGLDGWSAADCFPLYRRLEDNDAPGDHHGRGGPVRIRTVPPEDPCGTAVLAACEEVGIPIAPFNTGTTVLDGANWFQINAREDGTRCSASVAYLHPVMDSRPNLEVRTGLQAKRLALDENLRCTGVDYLSPDLIRTLRVHARREVIVSCGAIDTPKLLMLSGIGPAGHLRETGVEVLVDSPGSVATSRTTPRASSCGTPSNP